MRLENRIDYSKLIPHISLEAVSFIEKWLSPYYFYLIIKNPRETKLGDYRFPKKGDPHKITINAGMPKSLCFLTLTHEIAHLISFDLFGIRIQPHGKEWKKVFSELIRESITVYEAESQYYLLKYAKKPKASFYADKELSEYFIRLQNPKALLLKDLEFNKWFKINNKVFLKLEKIKTRYICMEKLTKKRYFITGNALIEEIIEDDKK